VLSWLACRIRSRAELELKLIALRHQVAVLQVVNVRAVYGELLISSEDGEVAETCPSVVEH
jgi:hypothetical protein